MNQPLQSPPAFNRPQQEEVHLQDYLNVIMRRKKIFVTAFLAVFAAVALTTFTTKPVYEATATLHVKDEKGKMGLMQDMLLNSANPIDSELEILKSRTNAENVVRRLHLDWQIAHKPAALSVKILEFISTATEPAYKLELTGSDSFVVRDEAGQQVGSGRSGQLMTGKGLTLMLSDLRGKAGDSFDLILLPFNETVESLRKHIKAVEIGKKTNIIGITYGNNDPNLARDVVNTLVQVYLDRTVAFKSEEASRTVGFVEEQIKGVRDELNSAEQNLQTYKSATGVVQLDAEAQNLLQTISMTEKQKSEVSLQKKQVEFALASLKESKKRGVTYTPAVLREEPLINGLANRLAELEVQKKGLLAENTEGHPAVKAIQVQTDEILRKIQGTYETSLNNLARQEADITRNMARYEGKLKTLPAAERDLARLTRLSKVNTDIYMFLLQKHEEARIVKASTISNIHIVDPAIAADRPVSPKKKKNLLLGLLVGLMAGIGLAFFQEYLDDTIKDADEAKKVLGLPLLALIPFISTRVEANGQKSDAALISFTEPKSAVAEAFRSLRTGIHFCAINKQKKVLLITSSFPAEGKSTIAANLAITFAHTGARVLLVDCDMRRSTLHEKFGHSKTPGLTELLAGDALFAAAVHNSGIPGLDMISAGTTPPNPAELLGSESMEKFLQLQRQKYDHIVIDAPPVLAVTDAPVLTSFSDLVVVVMQAGRVPRKAAVRLKEVLATIQAPIAGIVVSDRSNLGSAYGYNYGYDYGYGYYQDNPQEQKKKWWSRFSKF